jgi:excisionase family DNA binding protein
MGQETRDDILHSWKEIAAYLGCEVRTCQRWAKESGLPVFKLGTEKGHVHAKREDIDRWIAEKSVREISGKNGLSVAGETSKKEPAKKTARHPGRRRFLLPAFGAIGLAVVAFAVFGLKARNPGQGSDIPRDFHISGSKIIIVNERNRPLGEYDTGQEDLIEEKVYRDHFQIKKNFCSGQDACLPKIMIKDIRKDSRPEILIALSTKNDNNAGILICLDSKGNEQWRFETGRSITFGSQKFPKEFSIRGFGVEDLNQDGRAEIMVISNALHYFPTQVALVSPEGKLEAEYWNSGQLADYEFYDYDQDGKKEIILIGLNNEYNKGVLIALDPSLVKGGSPQLSPHYQSAELEPGSEEFYILFPHHEIGSKPAAMSAINNITRLQDQFYLYSYPPDFFFSLSFEMKLTSVSTTNYFKEKYAQLSAEGKLKGPLVQEQIEAALMIGLQYWNGKQWVGHFARADGKPAA